MPEVFWSVDISAHPDSLICTPDHQIPKPYFLCIHLRSARLSVPDPGKMQADSELFLIFQTDRLLHNFQLSSHQGQFPGVLPVQAWLPWTGYNSFRYFLQAAGFRWNRCQDSWCSMLPGKTESDGWYLCQDLPPVQFHLPGTGSHRMQNWTPCNRLHMISHQWPFWYWQVSVFLSVCWNHSTVS